MTELHSMVLSAVAIALIASCPIEGDAAVVTHDVAFKVGTNSSIIWFEIDDPSVGGTLQVTNAPYGETANLNAATVDTSDNQLIYLQNTQGYAISLAGLQLVQNGVTAVTTDSLGTWPDGGPAAGYYDGKVYYLAKGTEEVQYLNFNSSGQITGYTSVGTLNGNGLTSSISRGDLDFDANGNLWVTGYGSGGTPRLWEFDSSTLELTSMGSTGNTYNGMVFDAAGQTMYAYDEATTQYGVVNTSTGDYQTILATDSSRFGDLGDLAQGIETIVLIPEPTSLSIMALAGFVLVRRRHLKPSKTGHETVAHLVVGTGTASPQTEGGYLPQYLLINNLSAFRSIGRRR